MRNLALAFCSIRPSQLSQELCDAREVEYEVCLRQLRRVLPKSYDLVICENTIDKEEQIKSQSLLSLLKENHVLLTGSKSNIGTANKGLGELLMLKIAMENLDYKNYENVSYISARKIFTCPYAFERTETLKADALISNPDFLYIDGRFLPSHKDGMYNDMFFSMKSNVMKKYADESFEKLQYLGENSIGSEQNLFSFVDRNKVSHEWIGWLGLVRNDWQDPDNPFDVQNMHIC